MADVVNMELVIGDKTLADWDKEWRQVEGGFKILHSDLNHTVGLYRGKIGDQIMVMGKGIEYKRGGGLRKRLGDFRGNPKKTGGNHHIGRKIREHIEILDLEILCTGLKARGAKIADELKPEMMNLHKPVWDGESKFAKKPKS